MKSLAKIQFVIAIIAALVFALPSFYLFFDTVLVALIAIAVWSVGLCLLVAYYKIITGTISKRGTFSVWLLSFLFNLPGLLGAIWFTVTVFTTTTRTTDFDLAGFLFAQLLFAPAIIGTFLGVMGCSRSKRPSFQKQNAARMRQP